MPATVIEFKVDQVKLFLSNEYRISPLSNIHKHINFTKKKKKKKKKKREKNWKKRKKEWRIESLVVFQYFKIETNN